MPLLRIEDREGSGINVRSLGEYYYGSALQDLDDVVENLPKFEARAGDVWILGFIKTGCHWMHQIVYSLLHGLDAHDVSKFMGFLEVASADGLKQLSSPRLMNTHFLPSYLPQIMQSGSKIIYTIRNPKDVVVSCYHHVKAVKGYEYDGTIHGCLGLFLDGKLGGSTWFRHVKDWWPLINDNPNALIVYYEELKQDPVKGIKTISDFLGIQCDDALIHQIAESTSFSKMSQQLRSKESGSRLVKGGTLLRKGQVGDWRNVFTDEMEKEIDDVFENELQELPELKQRIRFEI